MEKDEVIEVLGLAKIGVSEEGRLYVALTYALKYIDAHDRLVSELEEEIGLWTGGLADEVTDIIKKAKGMIE